ARPGPRAPARGRGRGARRSGLNAIRYHPRMAFVERPDGARVRYEVYGSGYPLLLIAPGGVSSSIEFWQRSTIKPAESFANEFMVIAMDQRHAGLSRAPLKPFSYAECNGDQL